MDKRSGIAPEFIQVGTLWLDARRGYTSPQAPAQPEFRVVSASHDTKTGYGVIIVISPDKYQEAYNGARSGDLDHVMRFFLCASALFKTALRQMLPRKKKSKGDSDATDDELEL